MKQLLLPFMWLYGGVIKLRNKLYDTQIKKSVQFEIPIISVGNLSTGGTGKTPHVEYLLNLLSPSFNTGVLSRGYGRRSKGYLEVMQDTPYTQTGDEALQVKRKSPDAFVAVCEERVIGIGIMIIDQPQLQTIILDDAFQHRQVKPGLSILLTAHSALFTRDQLLPIGNLREQPAGAARADIIIITKCPSEISENEKDELRKEVEAISVKPVFFSSLKYGKPFSLFEKREADLSQFSTAMLLTGIASSQQLYDYLKTRIADLTHEQFSDHHHFTLQELKTIVKKCRDTGNKVLLTTEKDGVRLEQFRDFFISEHLEIYCVPVEVDFLVGEKEKFDAVVFDFMKKNEKA